MKDENGDWCVVGPEVYVPIVEIGQHELLCDPIALESLIAHLVVACIFSDSMD
jgi:hypothetical protein